MADIEVKVQRELVILIKDRLLKKLNEAIKEIKKIVMTKYDELSDMVTDPYSKTNPILYRDEFIKRLDTFPYIENIGETVSLNVPDMETFDFSGGLRIIETILNGIAGNYVEMSLEEFTSIFKRTPFSADSKGIETLASENIFLIRYNNNIANIERHLNREFTKYPFSNVSSFDLLEKGEEFVNKNMEKWIETALEEAQNDLSLKYKGATL